MIGLVDMMEEILGNLSKGKNLFLYVEYYIYHLGCTTIIYHPWFKASIKIIRFMTCLEWWNRKWE